MLEELDTYFDTPKKQIRAYYSCTTGRAQELLLPRMDGDNMFVSAEEVIRELDKEFLDYTKKEKARVLYYKLQMQVTESYLAFRKTFRQLAIEGSISKQQWFDDLVTKITPSLRMATMTERMRLNGSYAQLDELLQHIDTEKASIREDPRNRRTTRESTLSTALGRSSALPPGGVLRNISEQSATSSAKRQPYIDFVTTKTVFLRSFTPPASFGNCFTCNKPGHQARDCPQKPNTRNISNMESVELEEDDLSENS
ncbi:hypothetical protein BJ878DRAFT_430576 [Calycina marina]|uniref:CCHC-type domain-containing protein n=1 Tax=Calycina marina TaxID=1763456 RepID=A0A9P8CCJ2_9HELO|nr:hypothetical protein BJ878DRAFT_430576 [Calycina marina]